ncbi:RNA polymerase sigma factor [Croceitalea marina]|uniref:RNA polymerase sigma factor n=1 Tax=Croceitalea marina TaxID=1775166 RepID=A0ABW5N217_9FLAO
MNEGVLIEKLRKGKPTAYKYLFSEYYQWLCNYIYNLSGNRSLSEDIVQEALISFWEKRERIIITTSLKSYLFKTCHNQFLQHLRTQKIKFDELDKIKWEALTEAAVEEETEFKLAKLNILIDQLPPRCKEIFIQSKLEKKKYKEIALDLGISVKTVENQMSKALHFLKTNATLFLL